MYPDFIICISRLCRSNTSSEWQGLRVILTEIAKGEQAFRYELWRTRLEQDRHRVRNGSNTLQQWRDRKKAAAAAKAGAGAGSPGAVATQS